MAEVVLKDINKAYGDTKVIKGVDLHIEDKEFCIFVGPSGCGKSTLLRMIAGLEEITSGDLHIGGTLVNDKSPADRGISMVFQTYALYPHMSVRENMGFSLKLAKVPGKRSSARSTMRRVSSSSSRCWTASRRHCPVASASGWPSAGQSFATPRCSCSTSRCRTWMPRCACKCALKSLACTMISTPP